MIKEWNLLRSVTCLCIVLLHSTTLTASIVGYPEITNYHFYRLLLCYATPTFIVLSVIILANRYPDRLPNNFWASRLKFIFLPFIAFAIVDGLVVTHFNPGVDLIPKIIENIVTGSFEGWFILVIFQFYFLHYLITRYNISLSWIIPISILTMLWYLNWMNGDDIPLQFPDFSYMLKLPFLAWFGYFTFGFVIGKYYSWISEKLYNYRWVTLLYVAVAVSLLFLSFEEGNIMVHSRRLDLFPLVTSITCALLAWGQVLPNFKITSLINNYAFGIYLVHWPVQVFLVKVTANYFHQTSTRVLALFVGSVVIAMIIIKLISLLPFGKYIIGKVKKIPKEKKTTLKTEPNPVIGT